MRLLWLCETESIGKTAWQRIDTLQGKQQNDIFGHRVLVESSGCHTEPPFLNYALGSFGPFPLYLLNLVITFCLLSILFILFSSSRDKSSGRIFNFAGSLAPYPLSLAMAHPNTPSRKYIVRPLDGQHQEYEGLSANALVRDLKERIFIAQGVLVQNQKLISGPEVMDGQLSLCAPLRSFCPPTEIWEAKKDIRSLESYYIPEVSSSQDAGSSLMGQARYNN